MTNAIIRQINSAKGKLLGEVFETDTGYGFHHVHTNTLETGFADLDSALDAWHCFHDEWFENLPR